MAKTFAGMDRTSVFLSPTKTLLGKGAIGELGKEAALLGAKKVLVVTDPGVVKAGLVTSSQEVLRSAGLEVGIYDGVEPEPPVRVVDDCIRTVHQGKYDLVVGLGGGSALDVAKGAATLAPNGGKTLDYVGMDIVPKRGLPKILVPTTAGTGSEATRVFIITDESENMKKAVFSNFLLADVAILDPLLTLSMPPSTTADTGMDAMVHAVETYVSVNTTPFAEILAMTAIELIAQNLPLAFAKGSNLQARYNMLLAANLAGAAFTSGGLGAVHGLAYVLGTEYHMAHGRSNAIMLPHVMAFNVVGSPQKFSDIARAMGEAVEGLSLHDAAQKAVSAIKRLLDQIQIPCTLTAYGIPREDLPKLVAGGLKQSRLFVPNPRDLTEKDVEAIYRAAF